MRKNLSALLLFFAVILLSAQNTRFYYEYAFKQDSLNRDSIKIEMMILDVSKKGSRFVSHVKVEEDSITDAIFKSVSFSIRTKS